MMNRRSFIKTTAGLTLAALASPRFVLAVDNQWTLETQCELFDFGNQYGVRLSLYKNGETVRRHACRAYTNKYGGKLTCPTEALAACWGWFEKHEPGIHNVKYPHWGFIVDKFDWMDAREKARLRNSLAFGDMLDRNIFEQLTRDA